MGCVGSAMVNPISGMGEQNVAIRYHQDGPTGRHHKKLNRLPHIFSRVLELPFTVDANVAVVEGPTDFRFVASVDGIRDEVWAHVIQIGPDVVKSWIRICIRVCLGRMEAGGGSGYQSAPNPLWPQANMGMESLLSLCPRSNA